MPDALNDASDVQETGDRMVFAVRSRTQPTRFHRVDLLSHGGYAMCSCTDWSTRRGPAIKAGHPPGSRATMCHHVILARRHFLNGLLATMAQSESEQPISAGAPAP